MGGGDVLYRNGDWHTGSLECFVTAAVIGVEVIHNFVLRL